MTESATLDRAAELERKIDALTEQVNFLTEEAMAQRTRREAIEELQADLTPIALQAIERTSSTLVDVEIDPSDLVQLGLRVAQNAELLEKLLVQLESVSDLMTEAQPILAQGVEMAITKADEFEQKGYFEFVSAAVGIVDEIVTNYSKEDVQALGENVVQMLDIFKDLTQPEMLAVAERLLDVVQRQADALEHADEKPPGFFALARKLRDPEIRRGMGRALDTLKAVSAQDTAVNDKNQSNTNGGV